MMFKLSTALLALATLFAGVSALADNPGTYTSSPSSLTSSTDSVLLVDACNGSNHYGVGHSCAFKTSDGSTSQGSKYNPALSASSQVSDSSYH